jgi:glycosyltransferase involved in cell wall biosynthesis
MAALGLSMSSLTPPPPLIASRRVDFHLKKNSFSQWKYRQVTMFIAASEAIAAMLRGDGVAPGRIATVHEGIDVERIERLDPVDVHGELWLPTQAPVVGCIGALVAHKGHRHLLEAAASVVKEVPDARFVILGEGPLRQPLQHRIEQLHLERHVFMPGFRSDAVALLRSFDLFVMPSETEGLGTSILDAMACGKAVIGTRAGGIVEVVDDGTTGILVPPADPAPLADAIVALLRDPDRRARMGEAGLARVREKFTVSRMVAGTRRVYEDVIGSVTST